MARTFVTSGFLALHTLRGAPFRRSRRTVARGLRAVGAVLFWSAGLPLAIGSWVMIAGGRLNGWAYDVENKQ